METDCKANELAQALIGSAPVMHLASADSNGNPFLCALEFVSMDGVLYWRSGAESKHSENLSKKPQATAYVTSLFADGSGEAVHLIGTTERIVGQDKISRVKEELDRKIQKPRSESITSAEDTREYWCLIPIEVYYMNENVYGYGKIPITQSK